MGIRQSCGVPSRVEMKARTLPSGAQRGARSLPVPDVACQLSPVATSASQTLLADLLSSREGVDSVNAMRLPSGESWGSLTTGAVM